MQREFIITRQGRDFVMYAGLLDAAHRDGLSAIRTTLLQAPSPANGFAAICHAEVTTSRGTFTGLGDADPENSPRQSSNALVRLAETRAKSRALADATNVAMPVIEEHADAPPETTPIPAPPRSPASRPMPLPSITMRSSFPTDGTQPTAPVTPRETAPIVHDDATIAHSGNDRAPAPGRASAPEPSGAADGTRPVARTTRTRTTAQPDGVVTPRPTAARPSGAVSAASAGLPATAAQLDAIARLSRSLGRSVVTDGLTRTAASELITQLTADRYPPAPRRDLDPE